ncbi:putative xyloglucan endotransglucosylase/hydrolase protein 26 [Drosera capensis]
MGGLRGLLIVTFACVMAFYRSSVDAALSNAMYFDWNAQIGRMTGWDSCQLVLTQEGGSGIVSKPSFLYGSISMRIKLVQGNSAGTVTTFYLSSSGSKHDEIDFEFLGNLSGQPYTIHTNIFTQGFGQREQQFKAWFDPTTDYHNYTIFWNPYEVVWLVDDIPIRVFRNYHDPQINFPDSQAMKAYASLWNGDQWATEKGRIKIDWNLAPYVAEFQNFETNACYWNGWSSIWTCASKNPANWWTNSIYYRLSYPKLGQMNWLRNNFMIYNYCTDFQRFNGSVPKECSLPQY